MIRRILYFALGVTVALFWLAPDAHANVPKTGLSYCVDGAGCPNSSMTEACTDRIPPGSPNTLDGTTWPLNGSDTSFGCNIKIGNDVWPNFYSGNISGTGSCPANSTSADAISCSCNQGYAEQGGQCVAQVTCPAAGTTVQAYAQAGASFPVNVCVNGCQATVANAKNTSAAGVDYIAGTWTYLGPGQTACQGVPTATAGVPANQPTCGAGMNPGTFNGQTICLPAGTGSTPVQQVSTKRTDNGDGSYSITTTTTTTVNNITTTTSSTQNYNANGTTNGGPSVTGSTGPAAGSSADPADKPEMQKFCEQNPELSICKGGSWSGTCPTFTCEGDAVQCAQARGAYELYCYAQADNPQKTLGQQIVDDQDPTKSQHPTPANASVIPVPGIAGTAGFLGHACPADQVLSYRGHSITLPWSSLLCTYFEMAGAAMLVVASIIAVRTIGVGHGW